MARRVPFSAYTAEQIDMLVAYTAAENAWYVVPVAAFAPGTSLELFPSGCKKKSSGRYEKYREAWDLMKAGVENSRLQQLFGPGALASTPNAGASVHARAAARQAQISWIDVLDAAA